MRCRCPNCHNPLEIVGTDTLKEIACPSCGSSFSLTGMESVATVPYASRRVAQFELLTKLGSGQFGTVWKAKDTTLDRFVALKLPRTQTLSPAEREKFFREARAAAQVKHPNIISVHEIGRDGDDIYIASDFIEGANLLEWLSARRIGPREAAHLTATICDALHAAHEAGIVHRDLKPANIMLDAEARPHIADFGLAKRDTNEFTITMDGQVLGTPAYMPPEQARGQGHLADRRSDIYSLGVILYQLLTGELPFRGDANMLIVQILNDDPTPLRKLSSKIPRDLETICLKCLCKLPAKRYATAKEMADDIRRYLDGSAIFASPPGSIERGWKWLKRNHVPLTRVAALVLTVVAAVLIYQHGIAVRSANEAILARDSEAVAKDEARKQRDQAIANEEMAVLQKLQAEEARMIAEHAQQVAQEMSLEAIEARREAEASHQKALAFALERDAYASIAKIAYDLLVTEFGEEHANVTSMRNRMLEICEKHK